LCHAPSIFFAFSVCLPELSWNLYPPTTTSQVAGITDMDHLSQPLLSQS
jgi:hypothetical protein